MAYKLNPFTKELDYYEAVSEPLTATNISATTFSGTNVYATTVTASKIGINVSPSTPDLQIGIDDGNLVDYPAQLWVSNITNPRTAVGYSYSALSTQAWGDPSGTSTCELAGAVHTSYVCAGNTQNINCAYTGGLFEAIHWGTGKIEGLIGNSSDIGLLNEGSSADDAACYKAYMDILNLGTIKTLYGLWVSDLTNDGVINNTYGVYIGDVTAGTQTNSAYGLYQADSLARNYLAGITSATGICATSLCATNVYATTVTGAAWDDIRIAGLSVRTNASAPGLITLTGGLLVYGFDGTSTLEQAYFAIQMPHNYKTGTNIHPHVHWAKSTAATGNVAWFLEYTMAASNVVFPAATTISAVGTASSATAWVHTMTDLPDITGTPLSALSSMFIGRIYRDPADGADTYEADAGLLEFDLHYQVDGLGSDAETTKSY